MQEASETPPLPDKQARISGKAHRLVSIVAARRAVTLKELLDEIILADPGVAAESAREWREKEALA